MPLIEKLGENVAAFTARMSPARKTEVALE